MKRLLFLVLLLISCTHTIKSYKISSKYTKTCTNRYGEPYTCGYYIHLSNSTENLKYSVTESDYNSCKIDDEIKLIH